MLKFDWLCQHSGRRNKNLAHVTRRIFPSLPPRPFPRVCAPRGKIRMACETRLVATSHRLASCVIVSRFRTALDLDTYPLSNFIRPRCAERAKHGPGKPVLIMHIGFLACFQAVSPERSGFSKIATLFILPL